MAIAKRADAFAGIHFDFHANDDSVDIGNLTTPELIQEMIDRVKPDFVQCDCKGHRGYSSYETKVGYKAPGFAKDNLRIWRDVTKANNVPLYMHYSGVWDTEALKHHPDWARVDEEGKPSRNYISLFSPYVDEILIPQLKELIAEYVIDGVWIDGDCWAHKVDYSEKALLAFRQATGVKEIPRRPGDAGYEELLEFTRQTFRGYVRHYTEELHHFDPSFQITSNWAYMPPMPDQPDIPLDYISGDTSPLDGYSECCFVARFASTQGLPWDLMPWWVAGELTNYDSAMTAKGIAQLQQEAAAIIVKGGAYQMCFSQNRDGSIRRWGIQLPEATNAFCRDRKPWVRNVKSVPQVAVLASAEDLYRRISVPFTDGWTCRNGKWLAAKALTLCLLDAGYSVDVVHEYSDFSQYKVLVLPELEYISEEVRGKVLRFTEAGGSLLLAGPSSAQLFENEVGVRFVQRWTPEIKAEYEARITQKIDITLAGKPADRFRMANYIDCDGVLGGIGSLSIRVEPKEGTGVLAVNTVGNDYEWHKDPIPAITVAGFGKGKIAALWYNMAERYLNGRTYVMRELIKKTVDSICKGILVKVEGSHMVHVVLNEKNGSLLVNLINTGTQGNYNLFAFDEIVPLRELTVRVKLDKKPGSVILQPVGRELEFTYEGGELSCCLDKLEIFDIIEIKQS